MERVKKIIMGIIACLFVIFASLTTFHFASIQSIKKDYERYYTENIDIQAQIVGGEAYIKKVRFDSTPSEHASAIHEVKQVYEKLMTNSIFEEVEINYIQVVTSQKNLVDANLIDEEIHIVQGRNFTEEEIKTGFKGVIISESIVYHSGFENPLQVGETYYVTETFWDEENGEKRETFKYGLEIIGIYESPNFVDLSQDYNPKISNLYAPGDVIIEICNQLHEGRIQYDLTIRNDYITRCIQITYFMIIILR